MKVHGRTFNERGLKKTQNKHVERVLIDRRRYFSFYTRLIIMQRTDKTVHNGVHLYIVY